MIPAMGNRTHATSIGEKFEAFSKAITHLAGTTGAFAVALGVIVGWAALGPVFGYSDTWQLAINTGTTIVTFLMVFLIQRSQNKDSLAIHLKLNEIVAAMEGSSNRLIDVESLNEKELATLHVYYSELAKLAGKESHLTESHSVEEARALHSSKLSTRRRPSKSK
jgi:low affinity Fe/Cu permease